MTRYQEFAIWGKPPNTIEETLLCAMPDGKPITEKATAENIAVTLEQKYGCSDCRIQIIEF